MHRPTSSWRKEMLYCPYYTVSKSYRDRKELIISCWDSQIQTVLFALMSDFCSNELSRFNPDNYRNIEVGGSMNDEVRHRDVVDMFSTGLLSVKRNNKKTKSRTLHCGFYSKHTRIHYGNNLKSSVFNCGIIGVYNTDCMSAIEQICLYHHVQSGLHFFSTRFYDWSDLCWVSQHLTEWLQQTRWTRYHGLHFIHCWLILHARIAYFNSREFRCERLMLVCLCNFVK